MTLQVLISTMHQTDHALIERMNIQSDAIVINQCDRNEIIVFSYKGHIIQWISLAERGVGLSRNTALMRATADILLFADDDVVYEDGYAQTIISFFEKNPKVGLATFNLTSLNKERPEFIDKKNHRIHHFNSLRYGAFRMAIKKDIFRKKNITFSLLFGGGAEHSAGEDNLFLVQALKAGIIALASNEIIGTVAQEQSTWFNGYNSKYYYDRGFLFGNMFGKKAFFFILIFEIKNNNRQDFSFRQRILLEKKGIKAFLKEL